jgi:dynein light chain LC8-type
MQDQSQITYATYPEYKIINNFEFMIPIEMPEDIVNDIIFHVSTREQIKVGHAEIVEELRKLLDEKYGKYWHVFCGKNFGAYSVHDRNRFLFFKYKSMSYLIYKTSY